MAQCHHISRVPQELGDRVTSCQALPDGTSSQFGCWMQTLCLNLEVASKLSFLIKPGVKAGSDLPWSVPWLCCPRPSRGCPLMHFSSCRVLYLGHCIHSYSRGSCYWLSLFHLPFSNVRLLIWLNINKTDLTTLTCTLPAHWDSEEYKIITWKIYFLKPWN